MSFASTSNGATNGSTGLKVVVIGGGFTGVAHNGPDRPASGQKRARHLATHVPGDSRNCKH